MMVAVPISFPISGVGLHNGTGLSMANMKSKLAVKDNYICGTNHILFHRL